MFNERISSCSGRGLLPTNPHYYKYEDCPELDQNDVDVEVTVEHYVNIVRKTMHIGNSGWSRFRNTTDISVPYSLHELGLQSAAWVGNYF